MMEPTRSSCYAKDGAFTALVYKGRCRSCGATYCPDKEVHYMQDGETRVHTFYDGDNRFLFSRGSRSVFDTTLVHQAVLSAARNK